MKAMKVYRVRVEYKVRGYVDVDAFDAEEAEGLAQEEIMPTSPFELVDWGVESVKEIK